MPSVVVLDYGSGNIHSAAKAVEASGATVSVTADRRQVLEADGLIVPGVGAFGAVVAALKAVRGDELIERRLSGGRPVLGICVGMQVLFEHGSERGVTSEGLGQWPGEVSLLEAPVVPHMGWNTVEVPASSVLFRGLAEERFYFVHSYAAQNWTLHGGGAFAEPLVTWSYHGQEAAGTTRGARFVAAVENGSLSATQFHPEKSGHAGIQLLRNWIGTL